MYFDHYALEDKSPHHQCTYSDCQVTGSMFFDNPSENIMQRHAHISLIMSATLIIHHIHMEMIQSAYPWIKYVRFALEKSSIDIGVKKVK